MGIIKNTKIIRKIFKDGFWILDENLIFRGLSRLIIPPKLNEILPDELHGTRFFTAKLISKTQEVISSGIISSEGEIFYFVNGKTFKIDTQWDKIFKKWKNYKYYDLFQPHKDLPFIIQQCKKEKVKRVLDLGCGVGRNLIEFAKHKFEVYGIDLSETAIKLLKKLLQKLKLKAFLTVGNIYDELPYKDNFFDCVVCVQTLQHGTETQIKFAIKEIKRVLKPKGLIFITVCGRYSRGKIRYCLVKTAEQINKHTYIPQIGEEKGLVHFIFNKNLIKKFFKDFQLIKLWKDEKDYYCILARKKV